MSRSLDDLEPQTALMAARFLQRCEQAGIRLIVTCTRRSWSEQAALFAQGRTAPGRVVTWAAPGQSLHQTGRALDVVPIRDGKPVWATDAPADRDLWHRVGAIGESVGLEWAGRWPAKRREFAHFQNPETGSAQA